MLFDLSGNRQYLTADEQRAFLAVAAKKQAEVFSFCSTLAYTGARISEVLATTPSRIDLANNAITFECLKKRRRGVYRSVPAPNELFELLEHLHNISSVRLDATLCSQRLWAWGRTTAWQRVKEVMQEAGVMGACAMPKGLRHAFGVEGVAGQSVPLNIMQRWLGHARITTTVIYANAVGREEKALAARMWT